MRRAILALAIACAACQPAHTNVDLERVLVIRDPNGLVRMDWHAMTTKVFESMPGGRLCAVSGQMTLAGSDDVDIDFVEVHCVR